MPQDLVKTPENFSNLAEVFQKEFPAIPESICTTSPRTPRDNCHIMPPKVWQGPPKDFARLPPGTPPSQSPKNVPRIWPGLPNDFAGLLPGTPPRQSPMKVPRTLPGSPKVVAKSYRRASQGTIQDSPCNLNDFPRDSARQSSKPYPTMWSIPPKHFAGVPLGLPNAVAQEFHMFVLFFLWLQLLRGVGLFPGPDGGPRLGLLGQSLGQAQALTKFGKNPQGHINYSQRNS